MDISLSARSCRTRFAEESSAVASAVGVQPKQCESPGARGAEVLGRQQRLGEQCGGPPPPRRACIAARALTQSPECPPVTIFRTPIFKPASIKAHEVAKPLGIRVPCMLDKCSKSGRQGLRQALFAGAVERTRQQQRSGIVIDTIAVVTIRHGMNGMLEQPGVVAHRQKMIGPHLWRCVAGARGHVRDRAVQSL